MLSNPNPLERGSTNVKRKDMYMKFRIVCFVFAMLLTFSSAVSAHDLYADNTAMNESANVEIEINDGTIVQPQNALCTLLGHADTYEENTGRY